MCRRLYIRRRGPAGRKGEALTERIMWEELPALFQGAADIFREKREELCEMDARMGDGDLGLTMEKGWGALPQLIKEAQVPADVGKTLVKAGLKMASLVPSTMGTLMAGGLMEGGKALAGKDGIGPEELAAFLEGFAAGIRKRGKCAPGDRTVLDAMDGAARAARQALQAEAGDLAEAAAGPEGGEQEKGNGPAAASKGEDTCLPRVWEAALAGAREGLEATKRMVPKFGKAAVFSAKALGTADQGAQAGVYLLEGLARYREPEVF